MEDKEAQEALAQSTAPTTLAEPHAGGRPTDYGPEVVNKLIAALQRGMSITEACQYGSISRETFYNWQEKYPEFVDKIELAKTYLFRVSKDIIADDITNKKDVRTAKWWLEKKDPEFNPRQQIDLGGGIEVTNKDAKLLEFIETLGGEDADETVDTETEASSS